ncbi:MAG: class I SAM-dependent methyltransferase [Candidatus Aenigmarchaeota archaeon]|nr:class I SAM-dependent methyltransferase [Candidatus Aenigmarchaeota archaeon]
MRPEARIKMGYYPTPLSVVYRIRSFLEFPDDNANVLDPCCGEGTAVRNLVDGARAITYGIELDEYRAEQAREKLDHVLQCGYEDARMSNSSVSCLFLNPPYDWQKGSPAHGHEHERTEKVFLKGTVRYLVPQGIVVYIVPQPRVTEDVAKILSYRFDDFNTYRFPDDEYEAFRQVVLFGRRKGQNCLDDGSFGMLRSIPYVDLPEIPHMQQPVYQVPSSPEVRLFRSTLIDEAELEHELGSSALWEKLNGHGQRNRNGVGRPPLPLHTGHLGLLLASGCLDGMVGEGDDRHIVRGKVEKVSHLEQEYEGDVLVEREVERYRVSVKVLTPDGEIRNLM